MTAARPLTGWAGLASRFAPGSLIVLAALLPSSSPYIGDTMSYAMSVVRHRAGEAGGAFAELWEFGHLLWRPLGALLAPLALAVVPDSWSTDPSVRIAYGFLAVSIMAALATGALCYDLVRRLAGWKAAALLTFGVSWANGFLMYALSGSSYIIALFFAVAALWVILGDPTSRRRQVLSAISAAAAVVFWFPFILTAPGLVVTPWIWSRLPARDGFRVVTRMAITFGLVVGVTYLLGMVAAGVRSPEQLLAWYSDASHGWVQSQQWKRAITGTARLMVDMSRDGILLKRFVLGDPYQSLTIWDLVRTSLWKLAAFYVYLGAIFWMGLRTPRGRSALVISLVALVPMLYFALVLLEPSSPERFLPLLPFMLLTMAAGWQGAGRWVVAGFAMALPLLNGPAFIEAWPRTSNDVAAQMQDVASHASPRDLVVTVTFADPIAQWMEQRVFHPSLSRGRPPTYQLIAAAEVTAVHWRQRFADRVLRHWDADADVWIRRGVLEDRPDPILQWVEGDHPEIRWKDVAGFLRQVDYDLVTSRTDGFTRVARTAHNKALLDSVRGDTLAR